MIVLPADATDEQIKQLVIDWIAGVAEERYEEALGMLYQGNINPFWDSADPDGQRWTPELLRLAIASDGCLDESVDEGYRAGPVTAKVEKSFAKHYRFYWLSDEYPHFGEYTIVDYAGIIHCDLPLTNPDPKLDYTGDLVSSLTLRMYVRRIHSGLALELSTIHCM